MEEGPLVKFLLDKFPGVKDVGDIDPFGNVGYVTSFDPGREVTINAELTKDFRVPPDAQKQPRNPFKGLSYNLDDVSVQTAFIRYVKNPEGVPLQVCKAREPVFAEEEAREARRVQTAMGGVPGLVLTAPPHYEGPTNCFLIKENPSCIFLNSLFIKTFMHLDAQNLMNGIIPIPPAVCAECNLPKKATVVLDEEVDYYVLVPHDHVLAWCLQIGEHWRLARGLWALEMRVKSFGSVRILYYIVGNRTFDRIRESCLRSFMSGRAIDRQRLTDVGVVSNLPSAALTMTLTYVCFPHMTPEMRSTLVPKLPKDFPPYTEVLKATI